MLSLSPETGKKRSRMIKIQLVRNGNLSYKGAMRFDPKKYSAYLTFLDEITTLLKKTVPLQVGGVRSLYSIDGKKIFSHHNLEDNKTYVAACSNETFKNVAYLEGPVPNIDSTVAVTATESVYSKCSSKAITKDYTHGDSFHAKRITIVRAGNRPRKIVRILLNNRNAPDLNHVMSVINEATKFDSAPLHSLYTLGGKLVASLDDIFGRNFIFFSFRKEAVCPAKDLQLTEEEVQIVLQLNKTLSSDNINLKEPPRRETENWKVMPPIASKYDLSMVIGKGKYSTVHKCSVKLRKDDGVRYAMKITRKNPTSYPSLRHEIQILRGLRHPKIVRLISFVDSPSQVYILYELLDRDLKVLLNDEGKIAEDEAKVFVEDILSALFYIHCLKIVHRGVSLTNLMVKTSAPGVRTMKLIDFGLACRSFKPLFDVCGETTFLAPEVLKGKGYGEKVDVWAVGVVLYYMLSLSAPFLGHNEEEDKRLIAEEKYDVSSESWLGVSGNAKHILGAMLSKNVDKRYTADKLLSHSWITGKSIDGFGNFDEGLSDSEVASRRDGGSDAGSVIEVLSQAKVKLQMVADGGKGNGDVDGEWDIEHEFVNAEFEFSDDEQEFEAAADSAGAGEGDVGVVSSRKR